MSGHEDQARAALDRRREKIGGAAKLLERHRQCVRDAKFSAAKAKVHLARARKLDEHTAALLEVASALMAETDALMVEIDELGQVQI